MSDKYKYFNCLLTDGIEFITISLFNNNLFENFENNDTVCLKNFNCLSNDQDKFKMNYNKNNIKIENTALSIIDKSKTIIDINYKIFNIQQITEIQEKNNHLINITGL